MAASDNPPTILVGVDGSEFARLALERAFTIADPQAAQVHAVTIVEQSSPARHKRSGFDSSTDPWQDWGGALEKLSNYAAVELHRFEARIGRASQIREVVAHILMGEPHEAITNLAAQLDAALIVVGTEGRRGAQRLMMGSVAEKVLRNASCPVLVVRETQHDPNLAGKLRIEPPPSPENPPRRVNLVEGRHTYHFVPRNVRQDPNAMAPLVFSGG